jgi:hypothetical protein
MWKVRMRLFKLCSWLAQYQMRDTFVGVSEEQTVIAIHRIFAKIRREKLYVTKVELGVGEMVVHYINIVKYPKRK